MKKNPLCFFLFFSIIFFSCEESKVTKEVYTPPPVKEQQAMFFLSWIAECTSDTAVATTDSLTGLQELTALGNSLISGAITNSTLVNAFGDFGSKPVWGPALRVSFPGDTAVLTDNLLYVVKSQSGTAVTYNIGTSGTNAISQYGWFTEDFKVDSAVPWKDLSGQQHGYIAEGSNIGLNVLLGLKDASKLDIVDFIKKELNTGSQDSTYTIAVTGHSLGGALSPLLALRLKEQLVKAEIPVSYQVEAWPYAGPTPGDTAFAKYLVNTLDAYHAFNNSYDAVPHVWDLDSIYQLCDLYTAQYDSCDSGNYPIIAGSIVSGFVQWAIGQSTTSGIQYHIAGTPNTFKGNPLPTGAGGWYYNFCDTLSVVPDTIKKDYPQLYALLDSVATQCKKTNSISIEENIEYFLLYFLDVSYQHTDAYVLKFFPEKTVRHAVNQYVSSSSLEGELPYLGPILGELLKDIFIYLKEKNITNCNCPT